MEIAAGVAVAAALDCIHADSDSAVLVGRHRVGGMRKAALRLGTLARPALKLAAHLQQTLRLQRQPLQPLQATAAM